MASPSRNLILRPLQAEYGHIIRLVNLTSRAVTTLAGREGVSVPFLDGVGTSATFNFPAGITLNSAGTLALVVSESPRTLHVCLRRRRRSRADLRIVGAIPSSPTLKLSTPDPAGGCWK
jgi:hypothetical protein